jgi:hypothetical protein
MVHPAYLAVIKIFHAPGMDHHTARPNPPIRIPLRHLRTPSSTILSLFIISSNSNSNTGRCLIRTFLSFFPSFFSCQQRMLIITLQKRQFPRRTCELWRARRIARYARVESLESSRPHAEKHQRRPCSARVDRLVRLPVHVVRVVHLRIRPSRVSVLRRQLRGIGRLYHRLQLSRF